MAVPGTVEYPTALDTAVSLIEAGNNAATTLDTAAGSSDAILTVASTATFPTTGTLTIEGEVIYYTGKTGTTFSGCSRGQDGTTAAAHGAGASVEGLIVAAHHEVLAQALIATQTKLGSGASSPASLGQVLRATGSDASEWTDKLTILSNGNVGVGTGATVSARLHALSTTEQLRIGYDASNYLSTTVGATGAVTFNAVGSGAEFNFQDSMKIGTALSTGALVIGDGTVNHTVQGLHIDRTTNTGSTSNGAMVNWLSSGSGVTRAVSSTANALHSSGTMSQLIGLRTATRTRGAGNVTDAYGLLALSNSKESTGAITNSYGIYVESQTTGTNNYALYTNSGAVRFGDYVTLPGNLRLVGYTSDAANPTTTELPADKDVCIHKNTSSGAVYLAYNDSGTIKKVELT